MQNHASRAREVGDGGAQTSAVPFGFALAVVTLVNGAFVGAMLWTIM